MSDITLSKAFQSKITAVIDLIKAGEKIESDRMEASIAVWQSLNKMGVDNIGFLNAPSRKETNNMWIAAYNTVYEAIAIDLYGAKMFAAMRDKNVTREQVLTVSGGRMKGIEKTKQYLQAQVGKELSKIRKDIADYIKAGNKKPSTEKAVNTDLDRTLTALAKVVAQMNKAKPDNSIDAETRAMFKGVKPEQLLAKLTA